MTELQLGLRFQMFGQPFVTGVYSDKGMKRIGSDQKLDLPEGSTFGIGSKLNEVKMCGREHGPNKTQIQKL